MIFVELLGLEPRTKEPESSVLHHYTIAQYKFFSLNTKTYNLLMRVESNHRSEAQNLVYLPLYDTSITLTQELKLIISRKLVGSLLLTVGRKEVWKTSSIYDLLLYCCGRRTRTSEACARAYETHLIPTSCIPQYF